MRFLQSKRILVAARCDRVRMAPHFYKTEQEIDCVLKVEKAAEGVSLPGFTLILNPEP